MFNKSQGFLGNKILLDKMLKMRKILAHYGTKYIFNLFPASNCVLGRPNKPEDTGFKSKEGHGVSNPSGYAFLLLDCHIASRPFGSTVYGRKEKIGLPRLKKEATFRLDKLKQVWIIEDNMAKTSKAGRNKIKCAQYRAENRREKNKKRRMEKRKREIEATRKWRERKDRCGWM